VQVGAFGDPGRDPRGWTITVAYAALVPSTSLGVKAAVSNKRCPVRQCRALRASRAGLQTSAAQDDAKDAQWFDVAALPQLAFDHKLVVRASLRHLAKQPQAASVGECSAGGATVHRSCCRLSDTAARGVAETDEVPNAYCCVPRQRACRRPSTAQR
jgi:hypothetical protein